MGTKNEQLTDDQLIAQFMGKSLTFIHDNLGTVTEKKMSYAGYYEEWNNLMPVVQKIHNTKVRAMTAQWEDVSFLAIYSDIDEVYEAVVEFIKWYNQNKS